MCTHSTLALFRHFEDPRQQQADMTPLDATIYLVVALASGNHDQTQKANLDP